MIFARIAEIVRSMDQSTGFPAIRLDDTPFRAYGLNSLAQVQLATMVEDTFGIVISDSDALAVTSAGRLVDLIERKVAVAGPEPDGPARPNLLRRISERVDEVARERTVSFVEFDRDDTVLSYPDILRMSAWLSRKIPDSAPQPRTLVIAASNPLPTVLAFVAALAAGARPLILPGPQAVGGVGPFLERVTDAVGLFPGYSVLAVEEGLVPDGHELPAVPTVPLPPQPGGYGTLDIRDITAGLTAGGDDLAFLQMTSASTGDSKLVAISHANACANLTALADALAIGPDDVIGTWLPLYHDMGLVGTTLVSFYHGLPLAMMKPTAFIRRPHRWIDLLDRFRVTITAAPTFAYELAGRAVKDKDVQGRDLSALRCAIVGAEPIRLDALAPFRQRFSECGLRADSLVCSYGMAESTLGTTMAWQHDEAPRYLLVDPTDTEIGRPVRVPGEGALGSEAPAVQRGVAVFSVGSAIGDLVVDVVDDSGRPLGQERVLGEITLRGSSLCAGYFDPATAEPKPFPGGVFHTGDLGFVDQGELFILERKKHVIIREGRNFLASLLEERVGHVLGRPAHNVIVLDTDVHDPASSIVAIVENAVGTVEVTTAQAAALRELDLPVDALLFAGKRVIPRTTSGKKKYHEVRQRLARRTFLPDRVVRLRDTGHQPGERP